MNWTFLAKDHQAYCTTTGMFTPPELDAIVAMKSVLQREAAQVGDAATATAIGFKKISGAEGTVVVKRPEIRDSDVWWLAPSTGTEWLFQRVEEIITQLNDKFFHLALSEFQGLQLTEYSGDRAGHYGAHVDSGYSMSPTRRRKLSFSMQLSDPADYDGGELALYENSLTPSIIPRAKGTIAVFRSHILHEVRPVTRGTRDSLVAWAEGPEVR